MSEVINETAVEPTPAATVNNINQLKPKMKLTGVVSRLELYGAFIDVGVGVNALIHISQLGKEHVNRIADVLNVGDVVTVWVDKVDPEREQIMVTMVEPLAVEWGDLKVGQALEGHITRLENFGAFVDIGAEREGLVHISELSHDFVKHPSEVVRVGDEIKAQVLSFSRRKRRIDLSIKALLEKPEAVAQQSYRVSEPEYAAVEEELDEDVPTAMEFALRAALGDSYHAPNRKNKKVKRKQRRSQENLRSQQEEILNRTLQG